MIIPAELIYFMMLCKAFLERTVNTIAKGNPMKAVKEASIIFRFERHTSQQSAKSN